MKPFKMLMHRVKVEFNRKVCHSLKPYTLKIRVKLKLKGSIQD
jgi:hypothetical protein